MTTRALGRRAPQQERSRQKIELIFEATTRLLEEAEPADISTNAIARLSGISIGTLYQYFPDKDAVFKALLSREFQGVTERVSMAMRTPPSRPGGRVAAILGAVLDAYGGREMAHRRLMQYSLERGSTGMLGPLLKEAMATMSQEAAAGPETATMPALSPTDAFVMTHAVLGVTRAALGAQASANLDRDALERSLARLVLGFVAELRRDHAEGGRSQAEAAAAAADAASGDGAPPRRRKP